MFELVSTDELRATKAWLSERLLNPMFYTKAELDE